MDGPQPKNPNFPKDGGFNGNREQCGGSLGHAICIHDGGDSHKDFCKTHPGVCHRSSSNDNVKVIHKTVVVHDRNNTPQTIIVTANPLTGTCFVTQSQIASTPGIVAQLLGQCTSITIIRG
jgi:hypothetical protein